MKTLKIKMTTVALAMTLAACGNDRPAPARPPPPKPAVTAAAAEAKETPAVSSVNYSYNPVAKRDPFRSPLEEMQRSRNEGPQQSCSDPLCAWDLDQLKLVAVVT